MVWTLLHERSSFQNKLESRGSLLSAFVYRLKQWREIHGKGPNDWPTTEAEIKEALYDGTHADLLAIKESAEMVKLEKERFNAAIQAGLEALATRFRTNNAIPSVPDDFLEKGHASIPQDIDDNFEVLDLEYWLGYYPNLDVTTAKALLEKSDNDLFPNFYMFAIGEHFYSQSWTDAELIKWCQGVSARARRELSSHEQGAMLTRTKRAKLLAQLTWDVLSYAQVCTGAHDLKHTAGQIEKLPLDELNAAAEEAEIQVANQDSSKAALVCALVEYIFSDVIEPIA